jgi:hypothetical protein
MEGLPEKAAATQSLRKLSPFVSGSYYHYSTCYRSSGRWRMFKLRLGLGRGFRTYARITLCGALWATCGSQLLLFFFLLSFLFRIFVVVFVSALASASICSLSLSLSHYYFSMSLYVSLSSLRSPRMSLP